MRNKSMVMIIGNFGDDFTGYIVQPTVSVQ